MDDESALRIPASGVAAMLVSVGALLAILGALAPVLPLYVLSLGLSPAQWGALAGSTGLLMIFTEPAWGWLADRWGLRRPYQLSRWALAVGLWLLVLWPGLLPVVLWQVVDGLFETTNGVLGRGYLVRAYPPSRQGVGLTLYFIVYSICLAIGSTMAGYLYQQAGAHAVFIFIALLGTLGALACPFLREPPPLPAPAVAAQPQVAARTILSRATWILSLAALLQFLDNRLVRNFLVLLAQRQAGLPPSAAGLLFGAYSLANVCFLALLNRFDRRLALPTRVVLGLAMGAASMLVYALAHNFTALLLAVTLDALGWALASPARIILVGRLNPPAAYGWALGLHGAFENVGVLLGPVLAGLLWEAAGPAAPYALSGVLLAVGAVVALSLRGEMVATAATRG